jgi:hypothetical protein
MNLAYAYPKSRFEPAVLVDLNARAERERLSKSALTGFFKLACAWHLRDEDARELLGGLSSSTFYEWKKNPERVLEVDRITRISTCSASTRRCTSCTATSWPTSGGAAEQEPGLRRAHPAVADARRRPAGHADRAQAARRAPRRPVALPAQPKLTALRQFDTCRLIPSRFAELEDSVLAPLADSTGTLHDLFDLDNATNERLRGEYGGLAGIGVDELVFGVPNFRIINAAYTYPRPEGSRFNDGERGAWYCAFEADTALAEITFHKTVEYQEMTASTTASPTTQLPDFTAPSTTRQRGGAACRCSRHRHRISSWPPGCRLDGRDFPAARRRY